MVIPVPFKIGKRIKNKIMKTVKEIMLSEPKYCSKNESLTNAVKEMSKSKVGSLPVIDSNKKVVGIITSWDICTALGKTDKPYNELKVHEVMTPEAHTCTPEDDANTALRIMRTKKVRRLPVVDKRGEIKGLISLNTIARKFEGTKERAEIELDGEENIVRTLRSIYDRKDERVGVSQN
jgi:CBS domain-containing protein